MLLAGGCGDAHLRRQTGLDGDARVQDQQLLVALRLDRLPQRRCVCHGGVERLRSGEGLTVRRLNGKRTSVRVQEP
jgi:hypothetical protein